MKILIIYYSKYVYPLRATIRDHLYSFAKYSGHRCFYLNMARLKIPAHLLKIDFDLVIFHTLFLSKRWSRDFFKKLLVAAKPLRNIGRKKIALPQDEFINTDLLCEFINEFNINHIFSVAPSSEWVKIYDGVDFSETKINMVLTGYLDLKRINQINKLSKKYNRKDIDIGYRAWHSEPWLGRHGLLKTEIASLFERVAKDKNLAVDISTQEIDTIAGNDWYKFLLLCKYTIGVEGGSSILDSDGSIRDRTNRYLDTHPQASFAEVEMACFPGKDGELSLFALSPRHLEACLTRTCQILIEGSYNNVLIPGKHFIELKRDFSNLNQILELMQDDIQRKNMIEQAYRDIVASGLFTYSHFVAKILSVTQKIEDGKVNQDNFRIKALWLLTCLKDWLNWRIQACYGLAVKLARHFAPALFNRAYLKFRKLNKI